MPPRQREDPTHDDDQDVVITSTTAKPPTNSAKAADTKVFPMFLQNTKPIAGSTSSAKTSKALAQPSATPIPATTLAAAAEVNLRQYVTDPEWAAALSSTFDLPYFKQIEAHLATEARSQVFPPRPDIFTALNVCPLSKVKVVMIGQDPYHDNNQAHGLCFSVLPGIKTPPSLANMYKELKTDIPGFQIPSHGYLIDWANQGILMLNATLTVHAHKANSHEKIGWQIFTDKIIDLVNERKEGKPVVFLLWGNFAQQKAKRVNRNKHKVIENAHPSPLSATKWFGCKCFSKCNDALKELGEEPINWILPIAAPNI